MKQVDNLKMFLVADKTQAYCAQLDQLSTNFAEKSLGFIGDHIDWIKTTHDPRQTAFDELKKFYDVHGSFDEKEFMNCIYDPEYEVFFPSDADPEKFDQHLSSLLNRIEKLLEKALK